MENTTTVLTIDIGGSHIKATLLNPEGKRIADYAKMPTPQPSTPLNVINLIQELVKNFSGYDKISVGFPGYVKNGIVKTAPNLGTEVWIDYPLQVNLGALLNRPAKVVNDADLQGLGIASGKGLELVVTLGTGFGTALLYEGRLLPHLELAHHPVKTDKDYDEYIGEKALLKEGEEHWNTRIKKVLDILKTVFNYDRLYISGGNAKLINFQLDDNIIIANNKKGIRGGVRLWQDEN